MSERLRGEQDDRPTPASTPQEEPIQGEVNPPTTTPGPPRASSIAPEQMTLAAVVAGSSGSIGQGIATAGAVGMAQGEQDYQRRWAQRVRGARGWQKLWRITWG